MKKKILVLSSTFPRWHNDHEPPFVFELSRRLTDMYDVHVLAPHAARSENNETLADLSVHRFRYAPESLEILAYNGGIANNLKLQPLKYLLVLPFLIGEYFAASKLIRKHHIDLVHAHWLIPQGLIAVLLKKLAGHKIKTLVTAHGSDIYSYNGSISRRIKKFILNNCENLTVVSNSMKIAVIEMGCICQVDVLPMGTDLNTKFVPDEKKQEPKKLIFVGRLIAQKGVNFLLQSFPEVVEVHPDATLQIIGHGPELASLKKLANDLGIEKNISFMGGVPYDDIATYLQSSQVAVFPYCKNKQDGEEGFGLVIIEALGCGCAVIATLQTAIMEIIKDKQTGLLMNEGDPAGISQAILKLLNEPVLRKSLADTGRAKVLKQFNWRQISQSYTTLIKNCCDN